MIGVEVVVQGKEDKIREESEGFDRYDNGDLDFSHGNYWYILEAMSRSEHKAKGKSKTTVANSMNSHGISHCEIISTIESMNESLKLHYVMVSVAQAN